MELFLQGLNLMVVGMLTVFLFLVLLVLAMMGAARFFKRYAHLFPEPEPKKHIEKISSDHADIALAVAAVKDFIKQ